MSGNAALAAANAEEIQLSRQNQNKKYKRSKY